MTDKKSGRKLNSSENCTATTENQVAVLDSGSPNGEINQREPHDVISTGTDVPAQQPAPEQPPQQPASAVQVIKSLLVRAFIIYLITQFLRRPSSTPATTTGPTEGPRAGQNLFSKGSLLDLYVYINEEETFTDFNNTNHLFWVETEIVYGDWEGGLNGDGSYTKSGHFYPSEKVLNNGSLYLHVFFVKSGKSPNPFLQGKYSKKSTFYKSKRLNKFKKKFYKKTSNLLTGETEQSPEAIEKAKTKPVEILSHWHPNLTINLVDDHTPWTNGHVPHPLNEYVFFDAVSGNYYPMIFLNDYWNLLSEYHPLNESVKVLNLTLTYNPISLMKFQFYAAQSMKSMWANYLGDGMMEENEDDQDFIKQALLDTSPYLLGLTVIVTIVHSIFEFLAFKNDIQFWNNRKSLEGLSVRSVFFNVFQSLIVLLYVMDNETNTVVRISVFIGLAIEIWKIHKVVNIEIYRERKLFGILPTIWFSDKGSYVESSTKQYDMIAFKYLSWLLFPLLGCYSIYSLIYLEHKGWYSWVLGMFYGFLLTFGFIMMTPQLFINYKLKSVAHLPWRMMTYKALNTFIDDVFAFVIKMPTMYRLGCLRDDIVFFIYLYQRWIYRVDPKRINEFGTSGEMETSSVAVPSSSVANGCPVVPDDTVASTEKSTQSKKDD